MATKKADGPAEVQILQINHGEASVAVLGTSPFICNRMSAKAMHELLLPRGRLTAADKATRLKHEPIEEFRNSFYRSRDDSSPTLIQHLSTAFKGALMTAALDIPGARKAQIGRLLWVEGDYVDLYGVPQLHMSVTRSADINKTPDVRTRAIIPKWACFVTVRFVKPLLNEQSVVNLFGAAGMICGVGDWRQERGSGNYGSFELVQPDDERLTAIIKNGGRERQQQAVEKPIPYDDETEELLSWYHEDLKRRGWEAA